MLYKPSVRQLPNPEPPKPKEAETSAAQNGAQVLQPRSDASAWSRTLNREERRNFGTNQAGSAEACSGRGGKLLPQREAFGALVTLMVCRKCVLALVAVGIH